MLFVNFIRWIFGYSDICIIGKFPERFLTVSAKNGLNLWNLKSADGRIHARIKTERINTAIKFALKSECELEIIKKHGLPYFCGKYKYRIGLLAGLFIGTILSCFLSCFIWNIKINAPDGINEYEIRNELSSLGFHEGIIYNPEEVRSIERKLAILDGRISWVSINVSGTTSNVELSTMMNIKKNTDKKSPVSNLKSTADGTITRIKVRNGNSMVKIGEGVRKGQLLVSGIKEYTDGSSKLSDSEGEIYAKTGRQITLTIPKNTSFIPHEDEYTIKRSFIIFGIPVPITLCGTPSGKNIRIKEQKRMTLLDSDIPIKITEEKYLKYNQQNIKIEKQTAEIILNKRLELYKLFITGNSDTTILSESKQFSEKDNYFSLTVDLVTEENICEKSYVTIIE